MKKGKIVASTQPAAVKEGITIANAGMVLTNSYVQMLFERLGLMQNGNFIDAASRQAAVHHLQYVVTGQTETEEFLLPLNKVFCGIPLKEPVCKSIEMSPRQREIINGLISAMIGTWPAIGNSSIDGFRGNWLVRPGLLVEHDDKWELTVEKRAYDLLINHSPFSFSIVKYPWMSKPIYVNWAY